MKRINIYFNDEHHKRVYDYITEMANKYGISKSTAVKMLLIEILDKKEETKKYDNTRQIRKSEPEPEEKTKKSETVREEKTDQGPEQPSLV